VLSKTSDRQELPSLRAKVLVLSSTYPRWRGDHEPGFVHELNRRLADQFEVHVISPHAPGAAEQEILDGVTIHRFRYAPECMETLVQGGGVLSNLKKYPQKWGLVPLFFLGQIYQVIKCLRRVKPDLMHAHWIIPQGAVLAMLSIFLKVPPFILTSHGSDLFCLQGRVMSCVKRWVIGKASLVAVVSQAMVAEVVKLGAIQDKVCVIPMGVDFSGRFSPSREIAREQGEILFVGRLVETKGVKYLIDAMVSIRNNIENAHLLVIGDGPEMPALTARVAANGLEDCVRFLGPMPQDRLPDFYRRASVFVAPFMGNEGLGLVTVEAIACGCPVVAGDIPAMADIFLDSESDMLFSPGDTDSLAEKISRALLDIDSAVQSTLIARERLALRLGWPSVAQRYANCLNSLSVV